MKNLIELSDYRLSGNHYILTTKSQTNAIAFYNQVKRKTPVGYECVLYRLAGGFIIEFISDGYIKGVTYIRQYKNGKEVINEKASE